MKLRHINGWAGSIAALCLLVLPGTVRAATYAPQKTITIAPFLQQVTISPEDGAKTFALQLTNNTAVTQNFQLSALDFGSLDETGGLVFAGTEAGDLVLKYGLAAWLRLSQTELTLTAGQKASVQATIVDDVSLSPGGHYGAIVASLQSDNSSASNQINVKQKISALVLATKVGGEKYDLRLEGTEYRKNWLRLPREVSLRFYNPGNVHVVPRGIVKLTTIGGKSISQGIINQESAFVLPETHRKLHVPLQSVARSGWWPAFYKLQVDYRYDGYDKFATKTATLHFINLPGILLVLAVLTGLVGLGIWVFRKRRAKRSAKTV
jgi:hypothetical protein